MAAMREGGLQALPFLLPALVLVFFFLIIPVIWTVLLSVNKTRGLNFGTEWIGLDNYERLLTRDSRFLDRDEWPWTGALINNIRWSKRMKAAGIKIIESIPGLKVHAKVALVNPFPARGPLLSRSRVRSEFAMANPDW